MSQEFSLERINRLVSDLEQELSRAPAGSPKVAALRAEIDALKRTLASSEQSGTALKAQLHGTHRNLDDLVASVEGEVLRDTPYLAELGRILGLV
ncbi:MAG: hypothetical protein RL404_789 [Pseudomonadota bacterium]